MSERRNERKEAEEVERRAEETSAL